MPLEPKHIKKSPNFDELRRRVEALEKENSILVDTVRTQNMNLAYANDGGKARTLPIVELRLQTSNNSMMGTRQCNYWDAAEDIPTAVSNFIRLCQAHGDVNPKIMEVVVQVNFVEPAAEEETKRDARD